MGLSVKNVQLNYGKKEILREMSFDIQDGETLALFGPSGVGKTSLLKLIAGIQPITHGRIDFTGDFSQASTVLVFQDYWLFPHMNVYDNIDFGLKARKFSKTDRQQKIKKIIDAFDLTGLEQHFPDQLSGGQKQRVALARAIVLEPKLLLLDEPFANLDGYLRVSMRKYLHSLQETYRFSTILVTHDRDEAFQLADRMIVLSEGTIQQVGKPKEIYFYPANRKVAEAIGETNFIVGTVSDRLFRAKDLEIIVQNPAQINGEAVLFIPCGTEITTGKSGVLGFIESSEWSPNGQRAQIWLGEASCTFTNVTEKLVAGEKVSLLFNQTLQVMEC